MESAKAIQIVTPVNHEFELQLEKLKRILDADNIKDRHCVVISIAGAFRKGKSFLLNFFLKYLYAQVNNAFKKYFGVQLLSIKILSAIVGRIESL